VLAAPGAPELPALIAHYRRVREGLGYRKSAADWGAFPADPYSDTPGEGGAQQPGMTGQVKEEILTRWGELGLRVKRGRVHFDPILLDEAELPEGGGVDLHLGACAVHVPAQPRDAAARADRVGLGGLRGLQHRSARRESGRSRGIVRARVMRCAAAWSLGAVTRAGFDERRIRGTLRPAMKVNAATDEWACLPRGRRSIQHAE
jgi:hypothetical protein